MRVMAVGAAKLTSEIILMNQHTVVLAADSAVSFTDADNRPLGYLNGVQKIFTLDDEGPICVMIYGTTVYCNVHWKVIFDEFVNRTKSRISNIEECAELLMRFLANIKDEAGFEMGDDVFYSNFDDYIERFVFQYREILRSNGWGRGGSGSDSDPEVARVSLEDMRSEITLADDGDATPRMRSICDAAPPFKDFLAQHLDACVESNLAFALKSAAKGIPDDVVRGLKLLVSEAMCLNWFPRGEKLTGLVIAGFGKGHVIPGAVQIECSGGFAGFLPSAVSVLRPSNSPAPPAVFRQFAMQDLLSALIDGSTPEFLYAFDDALWRVLDEKTREFDAEVGASQRRINRSEKDKDIVASIFSAIVEEFRTVRLNHGIGRYRKIVADIEESPQELLTEYARKLMRINLYGMEVLHESAVARPIRIFSLSKGKIIEELES
jgi:hypothetical protein